MFCLWLWSLFIILTMYRSCMSLIFTVLWEMLWEGYCITTAQYYFNYLYVFNVSSLNLFLILYWEKKKKIICEMSFSEWLRSSPKVSWSHYDYPLWSFWPLDHIVSISCFPVISLFFLWHSDILGMYPEVLWELNCFASEKFIFTKMSLDSYSLLWKGI